MRRLRRLGLLLTLIFVSTTSYATQFVRWTAAEDPSGDLSHILSVIQVRTGIRLSSYDLTAMDNRDLAYTHYARYVQLAGGVPIQGTSLRIWTDLATGQLVQIEGHLENMTIMSNLTQRLRSLGLTANTLNTSLSSPALMGLVRQAVRSHDDTRLSETKWTDGWDNNQLVRRVVAKAQRGRHIVNISLETRQVLNHEYVEFPQTDELSVRALVYPIYEEVESTNQRLERVPTELKYINPQVAHTTSDPYAVMRDHHYYENMMDPILGETEEGRAQGYWSMNYLKNQATQIRRSLPTSPNAFENGGVLLQGRYATINLHPMAAERYQGLNFTPGISSQFKPDWRQANLNGADVWEMIPSSALLGKPLLSADEALARPARRLADHNPTEYINDGFDEIQVYHAINTLFDELRPMGFTDPDLSTRPFHAFLFDPDISMRNNAFYTDDTINFTTYSGDHPNFARDNPTIWHELGHGIMDRLMGDAIRLADTGGLSEGMADTVGALLVTAVSRNQAFPGFNDFRIINKTGFYLTNEVHDDGEAYGGVMKDMLDAALQQNGSAGLTKVTDLILETMRLCRDHPALTAQGWFEHMLFADALGRPQVRASGELRQVILDALNGRNFSLTGTPVASLTVRNETDGNTEVTSNSAGSRSHPILVSLQPTEQATYNLNVNLQSSEHYRFQYPVQVKVGLRGGPIQGAIHWVGEEQQPLVFTLNSENDIVHIPLTVTGTCDYSNRDDGSCVDFAYIQIWNAGETSKPVAKKRFYLRVRTPQP